jgi:hypothetical protein
MIKVSKGANKNMFLHIFIQHVTTKFFPTSHTYFPDVSHAPRVAGKVTEATVEELHGDYFTPMMEAVQRFLWG